MGKIKTENIFVGNRNLLTPFNLPDRLIVKHSEQSTPDWLFAPSETITKVENQQDERKETFFVTDVIKRLLITPGIINQTFNWCHGPNPYIAIIHNIQPR